MANAAQIQHTAVLASQTINTPNSGLDGSGTIASIITGGTNGTQLQTLIIKAQTSITSEGMIRLFIKRSGGSIMLLREIYVPIITKSSRDSSFSRVIPFNFLLEPSAQLQVSTQTGDTLIVAGFDLSYVTATSYIGSNIEYVPKQGADKVNLANSALDGSGSMTQIVTAGTSATYNGCLVSSIVIKSQVTNTPGMVRFFYQNASSGPKVLFFEVEIPAYTQANNLPAFTHQAIANGGLCLAPGYSIWASTENGETFSIQIDAADWKFV
jgi:hypothetical protein